MEIRKLVARLLGNIDNIIKAFGLIGIGFSVILVVIGIIGWIADVNYDGWAFFLSMLMYAIASFVSSIPVLGFYFVVKAAMFYLRTNEQLEENEIEDAEEK